MMSKSVYLRRLSRLDLHLGQHIFQRSRASVDRQPGFGGRFGLWVPTQLEESERLAREPFRKVGLQPNAVLRIPERVVEAVWCA